MLIGKKIRSKRTEKNLSADYMAEQVGIDISTYRKYERDDVSPSLEKLKRIADVLGTPVVSLIESPDLDPSVRDNILLLYNSNLQLSQKAMEQYERQITDLKADKEYLKSEITALKIKLQNVNL